MRKSLSRCQPGAHDVRLGQWAHQLELRAPRNKVVVAVANKLARIAWAVLSTGNEYRSVAVTAAWNRLESFLEVCFEGVGGCALWDGAPPQPSVANSTRKAI